MALAAGLFLAAACLGQQDADQPVGPMPDEAAAAVARDAAPREAGTREELSLLSLVRKGGALMIPIGLMSLLVVMLVFERLISLRRAKVIPGQLIRGLNNATRRGGGFDPRQAYRICQEFPSATSNVVRAMLLKVGRPLQEVEHAAAEASEREANRLYANVRWLNLAAAVSPLIGLLGTVWGMIQAFFQTTQLEAGQNKADFLASGIYVALVTTLGGLAVAIPAAICSHYFEGRIQALFHQIDELVFSLLPQVEQYEGRLRVRRKTLSDTDEINMEDSFAETETAPDVPSGTASTG
jgi:biopolymer transport protein ExbB